MSTWQTIKSDLLVILFWFFGILALATYGIHSFTEMKLLQQNDEVPTTRPVEPPPPRFAKQYNMSTDLITITDHETGRQWLSNGKWIVEVTKEKTQ